MTGFTIPLRRGEAFSLEASAKFACGFTPAAGSAGRLEDGRLVMGFLDEAFVPVTVALRQRGLVVEGESSGAADVDAIRRQVARILSLDHDGSALPRVDAPVVRRLLAEAPGFRPVCFPSAYEAAVWGVLAQRAPMTVAARVKQRLAAATGTLAEGFGRTLFPCPPPRRLLAVEALPGVSSEKLARLHAVAAAALDGRLDVARLRAMAPSEALADLRAIRGVGRWTAEHILVRGAGTVDELPLSEPRVLRAIAEAYGLDATPSEAEAARIGERWRPFRTWVSVLLVMNLRRSAGRFANPRPVAAERTRRDAAST
ncbi:MAG: hypothetical protein KF819_36655 [Labilithrix sp.]|nr:hypothetical protein [Labilithrix sp.]